MKVFITFFVLFICGMNFVQAKVIIKDEVKKHFIQALNWCQKTDRDFSEIPMRSGMAGCPVEEFVLVENTVKVRNSRNPIWWAFETFDLIGDHALSGAPESRGSDFYVIEADFKEKSTGDIWQISEVFTIEVINRKYGRNPLTFQLRSNSSQMDI